LTALSVINNGVREILPFVRYIGQYIDFEFDSIKKQNKGKGVVCAATWYVLSTELDSTRSYFLIIARIGLGLCLLLW
jgi:hypothetical protein